MSEVCAGHSGLVTEIKELKSDMGYYRDKIDSLMTRLNVILGGVLVAVILLCVDIVIKVAGKI